MRADPSQTRWDYIIVGAGSAGCVLADRLSADGRAKVLLLEAGGDNRHPLVHMPKGMAKLVMNAKHTWYFPVAQARGEGEPASEIWVRGLGLGGSSAINGMIYVRGQPQDYREWENKGAVGWGWDTMKRAFRAIEDHELGDDGHRGVGGPVRVGVNRFRYPVAEALITAGEEIGLPRRDDFSGEDQEGVGYYAHNIRGGRRQSAATVFLDPARKRSNLEIVTHAVVDKIVFVQGRATSVEAFVADERRRYDLEGEVLLAAGALMSPAILQRSGVGPAHALRKAGVEPLVDSLDVGRRLRDHLGFSFSYRLRGDQGVNREFYGAGLGKNLLRYYLTRGGPLATGPFEVGAFVRSSAAADRPDVQLYMGGFTFARSDDDNFPVPLAQVERTPGATCYGQLLRPTSEGEVAISSPDPATPPRITPNWMTTPEDRVSAVAMMRYIRRYMAQPAIARLIDHESFPGVQFETDDALFDVFRRLSTCGTHAVATCRMGSDNTAVLDSDLRVRGVSGVRVVDCSAMPAPVSGNTNAPAMAFAWAAADRIQRTA